MIDFISLVDQTAFSDKTELSSQFGKAGQAVHRIRAGQQQKRTAVCSERLESRQLILIQICFRIVDDQNRAVRQDVCTLSFQGTVCN